MSTPAPFTFDWTAERANGHTSFLSWMVTHLITTSGAMDDRRLLDQLTEATNRWSEVTLSIQLNGVEMDAEAFLTRWQAVTTDRAERAAAEMVRATPMLDRVREAIDTAEQAMQDALRDAMRAHGIELPEEER